MVWNSFKCSTLVKSSHQDVILQPQFFNKTSWLHKLDHCIRRFSCCFNDSATKLQSKMELNYKQAWLNTIHNGHKLRSHAVFKRDFFLEIIHSKSNSSIGKTLHALESVPINFGCRQAGSTKPPLKTDYVPCVTKVEDEFHFMISCNAYEKPRDHLIRYLSSLTDIENVSDNEIFSAPMSCNNSDYEFTKAVCNFVNLCFEIRSDHLKSVNQII